MGNATQAESSPSEPPVPDIPVASNGFRIGMQGKNPQLKNVAVPFLQELGGALTKRGFTENIEQLNLPVTVQLAHQSRRREWTASSELTHFAISFALFMGDALTAWAAKKFYDEVYTVAIKPALQNLAKNFGSHSATQYDSPLTVSFSMFYQVERIQLTVNALCTNSAEIELAQAQFPLAQQRLLERLERFGIQGSQYTFHFSNGQLSAFPHISNDYVS